MQPKYSLTDLFIIIAICSILVCLMLPAFHAATKEAEQVDTDDHQALTVKEELRIRDETKKLNFEILESKAKVWKAIANDPKLLTHDMIRVLDK